MSDRTLADDQEVPAIEISIRRYLTPEIIAGAFIRMNSREQAEVFHQIQQQAEELFNAQQQWCFLAHELLKEGPLSPGWRFACDIGAFTMIHTYGLLEKREGRTV